MTYVLHALELAGSWLWGAWLVTLFFICGWACIAGVLRGWRKIEDAGKRHRERRDALRMGRVTPAVAAYLPPEPWSPPSRERPALADLTEEMWEALHGTGPAPHEASAAERIKGRRAA